MQYRLNHWAALVRFLDDPQVPLDNNFSERELRKVALLRNNSLYAGGEDSARGLCVALTLIQTCRLLGVNPYETLVWALERVVFTAIQNWPSPALQKWSTPDMR